MTNLVSKKQFLVGLLDRSGSMAGKEEDTIGGWNVLVSEMKNNSNGDTIYVSLYVFDNDMLCIYDSVNINNVRELTINDYVPRGQTAIDDALGITLTKYISGKTSGNIVFDSCVIALSTDGYENASKNFNNTQVSNLINKSSSMGITVLYLAANQDAIAAAASRGIAANHALNFNTTGDASRSAYVAVSRVASSARSNPTEVEGFTLPERQASQPVEKSTRPYSPTQAPRVARVQSFHEDRLDALNNFEGESSYIPNVIRPRVLQRVRNNSTPPTITPPAITRNNANTYHETGPDAV